MYPSIKVYLKPLLFESDDGLHLQRRIGAFEVQMYSMNKKVSLYSKLKTKAWPDMSNLVNRIPRYLKKVNMLIQLTFDDYKDYSN